MRHGASRGGFPRRSSIMSTRSSARSPLFVIATAYAVRLSYLAVAQSLGDRLADYGGTMEMGEMAIPQQGSDRLLPTALYARWRAD